MTQIACFLCQRIKAGTKESYPGEKLSHGLCSRCTLTREDYLGATLADLMNPEMQNDPVVKDAFEYAKDVVRGDIKNNVEWIGDMPEQTEVEKKFYDMIHALVEKEIQSETKSEMKRM